MTPTRTGSSMSLGLTLLLGIAVPLLGNGDGHAHAQDPSHDDPQTRRKLNAFFESDVRPVLAQRCWSCHGPDKRKGGLRLDSLAYALQGGDAGPAVVPGNLDESLLVEAVRRDGLEMPPAGPLDEREVATLVRWVELGAPWPETGSNAPAEANSESVTTAGGLTTRPRNIGVTAQDRRFWSFQPPPDQPPADPRFIDHALETALDAQGITPSPRADRPTLIRRLTLDLWGLPPTPEQIDAYVNDPAPEADAYAALVDRLLNSPRYAERQARHWLDLARYSESDGYRQDADRPHVWHYRDYVVNAFHTTSSCANNSPAIRSTPTTPSFASPPPSCGSIPTNSTNATFEASGGTSSPI